MTDHFDHTSEALALDLPRIQGREVLMLIKADGKLSKSLEIV